MLPKVVKINNKTKKITFEQTYKKKMNGPEIMRISIKSRAEISEFYP